MPLTPPPATPMADEVSMRTTRRIAALLLVAPAVVPMLTLAACTGPSASGARGTNGVIVAVGAENQYANVIGQIGGRWVSATAIESNPNTDPHTSQHGPRRR